MSSGAIRLAEVKDKFCIKAIMSRWVRENLTAHSKPEVAQNI